MSGAATQPDQGLQVKLLASKSAGRAAPRPLRIFSLANCFTYARFALAPVVVAFLFVPGAAGAWAAGWIAGFAMFTDFLDGYFARRSGEVSDLGKIFDPLADAVFFVIVWAGLGLSGALPLWLCLPFMAREFIQHVYLRPLAAQAGVVMGALIWGKLKTISQTVALVAVMLARIGGNYFDGDFARWGGIIGAVLVGITAAISVASIVPYFTAVAKAQIRARRVSDGAAITDSQVNA
ncbi:MAG: CDP-alcohol phosphatidyltransferase family protein [Planctomycetes bacterium]|nr:CDP-alcohol phosphatidyltransferase family protein [Planctomycetota bacterium]